MKPVLIILHLLMLTGSGLSLYDLWAELSHVHTDKPVTANLILPEMPKPESISLATARPLFDVVQAVSAASEHAISEGESTTVLSDQKKRTFQIKGIFTSRTDRFALLEQDSTKGGQTDIRKVTEGTGLEAYIVSAIGPRVVRLTDTSSGENIRLKAFSRIDADSNSSGIRPDVLPNSVGKSKKIQP